MHLIPSLSPLSFSLPRTLPPLVAWLLFADRRHQLLSPDLHYALAYPDDNFSHHSTHFFLQTTITFLFPPLESTEKLVPLLRLIDFQPCMSFLSILQP